MLLQLNNLIHHRDIFVINATYLDLLSLYNFICIYDRLWRPNNSISDSYLFFLQNIFVVFYSNHESYGISITCSSKNKYSVTTHVKSIDNTEDKNYDKSCNAANCVLKPISRCTICSEYYCYGHTTGHDHAMDNFEILK